MAIIKKVRLVACPEPVVHQGVSLEVCPTAEQLTFQIYMASMASGQTATIDWGDGTVEDYTRIYGTEHTYAEPGTYEIKISDVITSFKLNPNDGKKAINELVRKVCFNTQKISSIIGSGFINALNLKSIDLTNCTAKVLGCYSFKNCTSLETFSSATISKFDAYGDTKPPFDGCTALTKIHFAAANESAITSSAAYQANPTLGAPNAEVVFDL